MDPLRVIAEQEGVFLRREAVACGYQDRQIAAMCRAGVWYRVKHGCYVFSDVWSRLTAEQRHVVLAQAVGRVTPGPVVYSHVTALIVHGIAVWGADLSRVHVTRQDDGAARLLPGTVHHVGELQDTDVVLVGRLRVTTPTRAVIEAATVLSLESALVSADSAQHLGLTDRVALRREFERLHHWPGSQKIHVMLMYTDGKRESVGETRSCVLFRAAGIPPPTLQVEVRDDRGVLVAITDFAWDAYRVFGEFDGRSKYLRAYDPDDDPADVVYREKRREDRVRELTGYSFFRLEWADLARVHQTARRFWDLVGRRTA